MSTKNKPSTVTRAITGTKEGIIALLREDADYHRKAADGAKTQRDAAFTRGKAEGIEYAINVLLDWTEATR